MKKSFVLYTDQYDLLSGLSLEQKAWLFDVVFLHASSLPIPDAPDDVARLAFAFIRQQMDRDAGKYDRIRQSRSEAGRKGGEAKAANQDLANLANAKIAKQKVATVADTVTGTVTDTVTDTGFSIFEKKEPKPMPKGKFNHIGGVPLSNILDKGKLPQGWMLVMKVASRLQDKELYELEKRFIYNYTQGEGRDELRDGPSGWNECLMQGWLKKQRKVA